MTDVSGARAEVQRCQWHKRESVVRYLPKGEQVLWRRKRRVAYAHPTYAGATRADPTPRRTDTAERIGAASLAERLEETRTLHRLGVFPAVGTSFMTTNLIESVMVRVEERTACVDHWRTNYQKLRWCAAALWALEAKFPRVNG